jgi:DNA-directed RNA polymerase specialized sigma54-like protein
MFGFINNIKKKWRDWEEARKYSKPSESKKMSKKEATEKKQPWVAVLDTQVNPENIRNGFFELDWNEYFVLQLRSQGYIGNTEEEVVDKWFQDLCRNIGSESEIDMQNRGSGFVQRALREDGRSENS